MALSQVAAGGERHKLSQAPLAVNRVGVVGEPACARPERFDPSRQIMFCRRRFRPNTLPKRDPSETMRPERYNVRESEQKWQKIWAERAMFATRNDDPRAKYYVLEMFPYPSGRIHMGHVRNYAMGDVVARYKRARGFNVLHPMGWDAFGMPAENAAMQNKTHPAKWTYANIDTMRGQLKSMGLSLDWSREIATCDPSYYKHQQKLFLDFLAAGLVDAQEIEGQLGPGRPHRARQRAGDRGARLALGRDRRAARTDAMVLQDQRLFRGSARRARRPRPLAGKSAPDAAQLDRPLRRHAGALRDRSRLRAGALAARPGAQRTGDLYDAARHACSARNSWRSRPTIRWRARRRAHDPKLAAFIEECQRVGTSRRGDRDGGEEGLRHRPARRSSRSTPTGALPVYVANFILMDYGTGAIFGCPAHDQRDLDFVNVYGLGATPVVCPPGVDPATFTIDKVAYDGDGVMINSRFLDGMTIEAAKAGGRAAPRERRRSAIGRRAAGRSISSCATGAFRASATGAARSRSSIARLAASCRCRRSDLPVRLPDDVTFDAPGNPLDRHPTWKHVACPQCGRPARRETDTMDTFVDSSWYFARFTDPWNETAPTTPGSRQSLAAGRPVYRRHRARDPASALFALLHAGDAQVRPSRPRRAVRRACSRRAWSSTRPIAIGEGRWIAPAEVRIEADADGRRAFALDGRRADRNRPDRENVEVEAQHGRPRRDHRDLRRRHRALVHAVRFAARARRDLDRGGRPGRLQADPAPVAAGLRDRARRRPDAPRRPAAFLRGGAARSASAAHGALAKIEDEIERLRFNVCIATIYELANALATAVGAIERPRRRRRSALRLRRGGRHPGACFRADDAASGRRMLAGARARDAGRRKPLAGRRPRPDRRRRSVTMPCRSTAASAPS